MRLVNECAVLEIGEDGCVHAFADRHSDENYCVDPPAPLAWVVAAGERYAATAASGNEDRVTFRFALDAARATLRITSQPHYFLVEVLELVGDDVQQLDVVDVPLTLSGDPGEPFAACALALNLKTNVPALPQATDRLRAVCDRRFGFAGAAVALIGCPTVELRRVMQRVVEAAPDVPHSTLGGPRAMDAKINRGSYLFNFADLTEQTVDDWIALSRAIGFTQIDFHGGRSFRFGDCEPNAQMYPHGRASMKAVIDRLHEAGIAAGLHTYSFFIDKACPWVTPVPDRRLGVDATFTLAEAIDARGNATPVVETTAAMSTVTGFFVRNSVTLRIDDELIIYTGVSKQPPYAFTGCQRGACGTTAAPHAKGATVHHLKELFGLFAPDGESTLLTDVAAATAEMYNACGFDMIYLDALDGEDIFAGAHYAWHYGSRFAFELCKRLNRPALMEMSTFHHHLWYVRSRMGAWDYPHRGFTRFIDNHVATNAANARMFLPSQLGWWCLLGWTSPLHEPTYPEHIEYLAGKALGTDTSIAMNGITPQALGDNPGLQRLADILRRYEELRHARYFGESIKAALRRRGAAFTLADRGGGRWGFRPVDYTKQTVVGAEHPTSRWSVTNHFDAQPLRLRIEALMGIAPYDAPEAMLLCDVAAAEDLEQRTAEGVVARCCSGEQRTPSHEPAARWTVTNHQRQPDAAWATLRRSFDRPLNLGERLALGLWVHGDGTGAVLNVQLASPIAVSNALGEHCVTLDFKGWRYVELLELDAERSQDYRWPYEQSPVAWQTAAESEASEHWVGGRYHIYQQTPDYQQIERVSVWLNGVPRGTAVTCAIGPILALPAVETTLRRPTLTLNGATATFDAEMRTGQFLEYEGDDVATLYDRNGAPLGPIPLEGTAPTLATGDNVLAFAADAPSRARVTIISQGAWLSDE